LPQVARALGEDRDIARVNLNISWTPEIGSFTSLTGFSTTKQKTLSDFGHLGNYIPMLFCDGASIEGPEVPNACVLPADQQFFIGVLDEERGSKTEEISQELRFTSLQDRRFRYTFGGYAYSSTLEGRGGNPISTRPLPVSSIPGTGIGLPPFGGADAPNLAIGTAIFYTTFTDDGGLDPLNRIGSDEGVESWSVFGGADYDFNDRLTGRVELRYTHTREEETLFAYLKCTPTGLNPDCGDDVWDLREPAPLPHDPDDPSNTTNFGSERFSSVTGRVGLDFRLNDDWMLYGSVANGDKPGGIQLVPVQVITPDGEADEVLFSSFDTEQLVSYELGLKGRTTDGRVGIDAALYFLDWSDIVLRQLVEESPNSGLPLDQPEGLNFNAGSADVWGWEITADVGFTDNLTGRFTVNWTDAELTDAQQDTFQTFPTFAPDGDVSGNKLLRQAEWMGSASLDYRRPIKGDWDGFARIDVSYLDKIFIGNDNQSWLPSRTTANLRFGVESRSLTVAIWARNLFDDDDPVAAFRDIFFTNTDSITPPFRDLGPRPSFDKFVPIRYSVRYPRLRTYGLTVTVRFGA
jgi:outer membrane receptor protein involved in Fe transport